MLPGPGLALWSRCGLASFLRQADPSALAFPLYNFLFSGAFLIMDLLPRSAF